MAAIVAALVIQLGAARAECPQIPPPVMELASPDAPETGEASQFLRAISDGADIAWKHYGQAPASEAGTCAVQAIVRWAQANTFLAGSLPAQSLGNLPQNLAGIALAYMKVRGFATPDERDTVESWLVRSADEAAKPEGGTLAAAGGARRIWLALALGATGMAAASERHWIAARDIATEAVGTIGPDGIIAAYAGLKADAPAEHISALTALVTLATLAGTQGEDFYALGSNGIDRLAALIAKGDADPAVFATLAGGPLAAPVKPGIGWSQLYALHDAESPAAKIGMPRGAWWLGGDVQMLVRALGSSEQE